MWRSKELALSYHVGPGNLSLASKLYILIKIFSAHVKAHRCKYFKYLAFIVLESPGHGSLAMLLSCPFHLAPPLIL